MTFHHNFRLPLPAQAVAAQYRSLWAIGRQYAPQQISTIDPAKSPKTVAKDGYPLLCSKIALWKCFQAGGVLGPTFICASLES